MTRLSVNLNKLALLRNARNIDYPNLIEMALRTIRIGAHGITVHPRPDQRHIKYTDVVDIDDEYCVIGLRRIHL
jgi:pyridoxine 5-phosphate synthase